MLEAENILMPKGISVMGPMYYLLGHSFEVWIKSFILSKGANQKCLRDNHKFASGSWVYPSPLDCD